MSETISPAEFWKFAGIGVFFVLAILVVPYIIERLFAFVVAILFTAFHSWLSNWTF